MQFPHKLPIWKNMQIINVKEEEIRTLKADDIDYVCITDIARKKNPV